MAHISKPNVYHVRPVTRLVVDLCDFRERASDSVPGFADRLAFMLPSLMDHHCSPGRPGGFFERVREGTLMGHVVEHVAIEILTLAGQRAGFGKTRAAGENGIYHVIFEAPSASVGFLAGRAAVDAVNALISGRPLRLDDILETLRRQAVDTHPRPGIRALASEGQRRAFPISALVDAPVRPPVIAVAGFDANRAAGLIARCLIRAGKRAGCLTDSGKEHEAHPNDIDGRLRDPSMDCCVAAVSDWTIRERGLIYGIADVAIWLDARCGDEDPSAYPAFEETAWTRALVVEHVSRSGCAILNADDPRVMAHQDRVRVRTILFSSGSGNPHLRCHLARGGGAVVFENRLAVIVARDGGRTAVMREGGIAMIVPGDEEPGLDGLLGCIAALHGFGLSDSEIRRGLLALDA